MLCAVFVRDQLGQRLEDLKEGSFRTLGGYLAATARIRQMEHEVPLAVRLGVHTGIWRVFLPESQCAQHYTHR